VGNKWRTSSERTHDLKQYLGHKVVLLEGPFSMVAVEMARISRVTVRLIEVGTLLTYAHKVVFRWI
jgi:hypothetical protein